MRRADTVTELIGSVDAFLIDQFGTLHDGQALYPGVLPALRRLRAAGARVALLSNSGKRARINALRLATIGVPSDLYEVFVTSGEVAWRMLRAGAIPSAQGARRCLLLERGGDGMALDELGLTRVRDAADADLVIIAGSEADRRSLAEYEALLRPAARRGVACLCLNPDRVMLTPSGPAFGAGRIAEAYERLGGVVTWIGKPHAAIYDYALSLLGEPDRARVAGIGDSVEHDIAGARGVGCKAWLVRSGIIADADDAAIAAECARCGVAPDGMLRAFG